MIQNGLNKDKTITNYILKMECKLSKLEIIINLK